MKKGELTDGRKMYKVQIEAFVTLTVFCAKLADHLYTSQTDFNPDMSMGEGLEILKKGLLWNGLESEFRNGFFDCNIEGCAEYNNHYANAKEWVLRHYPYLKDSDNSQP